MLCLTENRYTFTVHAKVTLNYNSQQPLKGWGILGVLVQKQLCPPPPIFPLLYIYSTFISTFRVSGFSLHFVVTGFLSSGSFRNLWRHFPTLGTICFPCLLILSPLPFSLVLVFVSSLFLMFPKFIWLQITFAFRRLMWALSKNVNSKVDMGKAEQITAILKAVSCFGDTQGWKLSEHWAFSKVQYKIIGTI